MADPSAPAVPAVSAVGDTVRARHRRRPAGHLGAVGWPVVLPRPIPWRRPRRRPGRCSRGRSGRGLCGRCAPSSGPSQGTPSQARRSWNPRAPRRNASTPAFRIARAPAPSLTRGARRAAGRGSAGAALGGRGADHHPPALGHPADGQSGGPAARGGSLGRHHVRPRRPRRRTFCSWNATSPSSMRDC